MLAASALVKYFHSIIQVFVCVLSITEELQLAGYIKKEPGLVYCNSPVGVQFRHNIMLL